MMVPGCRLPSYGKHPESNTGDPIRARPLLKVQTRIFPESPFRFQFTTPRVGVEATSQEEWRMVAGGLSRGNDLINFIGLVE
jgi:hypothetical protein